MSDTNGMKFDGDKIRMDLIPPECIEEVGKVLTFGAKKYDDDNWKHVENMNDRYYAAVLRHLLAYRKGEKLDEESGLSHLSHAATGLFFLIWSEIHVNG